MPLEQQRQVRSLENVKRMPGLVQERAHIVVHVDGVHEDQRQLAHRQRVAKAAGRLALAVVEVEQAGVRHRLELAPKVRLHVGEDVAGVANEVAHVGVRPQRCPSFGIDQLVPRPELIHAQVGAPTLLQAFDGGQHRLLHGFVKAKAVVRRVVESVFLEVRVVAVVLMTGVLGDGLAQVVHAVEEVRQGVALLDVRLVHPAKCAFAHLPVVVLQERRHPRGRHLLAIPVHGHRADHLRPFGRKLRELGLERHVGRAEELHLVAKPLHGRLEARADISQLDEALLQLRPLLLGSRCDLAAEPELRFLRLGVGRVSRVREIRQRGGLSDQGLERRPVLKPRFDVAPIQGPRRELFVEGQEVAPARVLKCVRGPR